MDFMKTDGEKRIYAYIFDKPISITVGAKNGYKKKKTLKSEK